MQRFSMRRTRIAAFPVARTPPERVRFATRRGFRRPIASWMTISPGGAVVFLNSMPP